MRIFEVFVNKINMQVIFLDQIFGNMHFYKHSQDHRYTSITAVTSEQTD
jgi:hypothetical protein